PSSPVVLRDREDGGLRVLLNPALDRLHSQPQHSGISQAKLAAFLPALAVNQRKVFGMILEVLLRRNQPQERMDERIILNLAPREFVEPGRLSVRLVPRRPIFIGGLGEEGLSVFESGFL